ncbi:Deoxyribonuclease II [Carabus blaptoides fortunei]
MYDAPDKKRPKMKERGAASSLTTDMQLVNYGLPCKNENDESVDWYVIYKLPQSVDKPLGSYMYISSDKLSEGWKLSARSINDSNSIPGLTLRPFYNGLTKMHILYNDETPDNHQNDNMGHTKGVVMSNETRGLWLIHSVPHYPPTDTYNYPESAYRFGQTFLCISFNLSSINDIGKQLQYNQPIIYKSAISTGLVQQLPDINAAIKNETVKVTPWYRLVILRSTGNEEFLSFAKCSKYGKEIYKDWVSIALKNNLFVESWLDGKGKLPSNCSKVYRVRNIEGIRLPFNVSFSSTHDHSKWTITEDILHTCKWICIGDINREERQKYRGGGVVCLSSLKLWKIYNTSVTEIEPCPKN